MAINSIDQFIDSLPEDWMSSVFVDRLENARLLVDDNTFGDTSGISDAVADFMQLSTKERLAEIERLRIRNMTIQWARTADIAAINALIKALHSMEGNTTAEDTE